MEKIQQKQVEGLPAALAERVLTTDPRLSDARAPTAHTHDDRYYTESEVDQQLAGKVNTTDPRLSDARTPLAHTHTSTSILDFQEAVQDAVAAFLRSGANVTLSYDDANNTYTVSAAAGDQFDPERTRDAIGAALLGLGLITVAINDAGDTIAISTTATQNAPDAQLRDRSTHTGTQPASTITGLPFRTGSAGGQGDLIIGPDNNGCDITGEEISLFNLIAGGSGCFIQDSVYCSILSADDVQLTNCQRVQVLGGSGLVLNGVSNATYINGELYVPYDGSNPGGGAATQTVVFAAAYRQPDFNSGKDYVGSGAPNYAGAVFDLEQTVGEAALWDNAANAFIPPVSGFYLCGVAARPFDATYGEKPTAPGTRWFVSMAPPTGPALFDECGTGQVNSNSSAAKSLLVHLVAGVPYRLVVYSDVVVRYVAADFYATLVKADGTSTPPPPADPAPAPTNLASDADGNTSFTPQAGESATAYEYELV